MAIKGAPGWWALHHWEPPTPPRKLIIKHTFTFKQPSQAQDADEIVLSSDSEGTRDKEKEDILDMVNVIESHSESEQYEDLVVDESDGIDEIAEQDTILNPTSTGNTDIGSTAPDIQGPVVPSADLKQQLLERLLMMDSSLLHNAIKKAKAKKMAELEGVPKKKTKTEETIHVTAAESDVLSSTAAASTDTAFTIPLGCLQSLEAMSAAITRRLTAIPVIRASPYENDLLKKCNRVDFQSFKTVARLRRKLLVRRQRRKCNLALFDLDNWMYLFLKTPESALLVDENILKSHEICPVQFSNSYDPQGSPYIADPTRSLYVKLTGLAAIYGTCPYPVTSPFTGKLLPEFIAEEGDDVSIPKLKLLNQLKSFDAGENDSEIDYSPLLKPSNLNPSSSAQLTVKYTNLRKEFVGQLNDLLSDSFWPGIDVSEALDYPDYAIIALIGLSVVGCAICNPEGYLSYLYIRPDLRNSHLATKLLSLLLPLLISKKDITLHVSVGNTPAMLLYQRIGFKPEEYIVNFYDKYIGVGEELIDLGDNSAAIGNKNAFFMRLKR